MLIFSGFINLKKNISGIQDKILLLRTWLLFYNYKITFNVPIQTGLRHVCEIIVIS